MLPTRSKNKEVCFPVIQQNMPLTGSLDLYHLLSTHNRGRSSPHSMSNSLFGKEYECFLNNMELEFGPGIVDRLKSKFAAVSSSSAAVPTSNCTIPTSAQGNLTFHAAIGVKTRHGSKADRDSRLVMENE